ncbi:MAG TPA: DUF2238 domain-containing protein [Thermoleophilia bacterium]|nr:DUF2238 domain-containing protein [Thermoleophilia bacterium]
MFSSITPQNKRVLAFTVAYMVIFSVLAALRQNVEFLYYMVLMVGLIIFVIAYHRDLKMSTAILIALSFVGLLHLMGGHLYFDGTRLYDVHLIGNIIRYDNFVHAVGIFVITLVLYSALVPHVDRSVRGSGWVLSVVLVLMAMGVGAIIEVVEFGAVLFFDAGEAVGGYRNNSTDLLFNLAGSLVGLVGIQWHRRRIRAGSAAADELESEAIPPRSEPEDRIRFTRRIMEDRPGPQKDSGAAGPAVSPVLPEAPPREMG